VHGVRKESEIDRGVRKGILARELLAAAAIAAAAAAFLTLGSCGKAPKPSPAPEDPRSAWYQLSSGTFTRISGIVAAVRAKRQPWTVQERVADQAFSGDTLYLAVNGQGLAAYDPGANDRFRYFYDSLIFAHRTITTLVPRAGEIIAHLYFNITLNTVSTTSLSLKGFNLVSLAPAASDYRFIITPFQENDPEWEAVGFMSPGPEEFLMEWKRSGESETRFAYTRFSPATGTEKATTRDVYQGSFTQANAPSVSAALSSLFRACRERLSEANAAVHFSVRSHQSPVRRIYRSGEGVDTLLVIPIYQEGNDSYALLPGGNILHQAGGALTEVQLPPLPAEYRYTDIVKAGGLFLIPWEEARFTDVGAAGLLFYTVE
jgi:hypothetical protein